LAATLLFTTNLNAQKKSGLKVGAVASTSYNITPTPDFHNSWYLAGFHERPIGDSKHWLMYGGTEYIRTGWAYDAQNYQNLNYLNFPHAIKLKLGPLFAQAGYALSFKIGERIFENGENIKNRENKSRIFNIPLHAGVGLTLGPIVLEARYNYGLLKLDDEGTKINYFMLGAGFRI